MADKLSYCQACLSNERKLYPLVHLQDLLRQLHLCEMNSDGGVCWECRSVILKFDRFKGQVGYAQQLLRHCHKLQDLKCLSNLSINVNSNNYEFNFNDPLINSDSEHNIVIKQEIETENICSDITEYFKEIDEKDDLFYDIDCEEKPVIDSDIYVDILNSSLKKERKLSKKFRTKVKPKKYKTKSKLKTDIDEEEVKQKFTMVVFTEEEMIRNREEKRNQPNFKKIPFKCDSCVLGFTRKDTYNLHMEKKHDENIGAHQCTVCHIRFPAAKQVERHSRKHYVCYRCRLCKYETGELWSAVSHCRLKHDGDSWQRIHCQECGAVAKTPEEMSHHMGTEHSIICNECGEKFKGHNTLRLHKRAAENMSDEESEPCRCYNKTLQEQPFAQQESRGSDTSVRESDVDASQKRSKRKRNVNGDESGLYEDSHEDSYLDLLIKKDQASAFSFVKHRGKKYKSDSDGNLASTNKESESSSAKKSVKRKIENIDEFVNKSEVNTFLEHVTNEPIDFECKDSDNNETMTIADKFSLGKSVVDTHKASKDNFLSKSNTIDNKDSDHTEIITSDDEYTAKEIVVKPQQKALENKNLTKLNIIEDDVKAKGNKSFKLEPTVTYSTKQFTSEDETRENNTFETGGATDNKEIEITASPISSRPPGALIVSRRILFDDDMEVDSDITDSSDNSAVSLKLRQIIKDRQHFYPLPCKLSANISVDECPGDLDIHSLKGTDIFLHKDSKCKIKVDDQTYKGIDESKDKISLPTSEHSEFVIKSVQIVDVGTEQFHEKIHYMDDNNTKKNQTNLIPEKIHRHVGHDNMKTMKTPVCNEKKKKKKNCAPWSSRSRCPSRCGLHHVILRKITKTQKKRIRGRGK